MNLNFNVSDLLNMLHTINEDGYKYVNLTCLDEDLDEDELPSLSFSVDDDLYTQDYDCVDSIIINDNLIEKSLDKSNSFKCSDITLEALSYFSSISLKTTNKNIKEQQRIARYLSAYIQNEYSNFTIDDINLIITALSNFKEYMIKCPEDFTSNPTPFILNVNSELKKAKKYLTSKGSAYEVCN